MTCCALGETGRDSWACRLAGRSLSPRLELKTRPSVVSITVCVNAVRVTFAVHPSFAMTETAVMFAPSACIAAANARLCRVTLMQFAWIEVARRCNRCEKRLHVIDYGICSSVHKTDTELLPEAAN